MNDLPKEELEKLKEARNSAMRTAEKLAYAYACACEVGNERSMAFDIYENVRNAGRVY
jgi:rRNA-processing protein FCF1